MVSDVSLTKNRQKSSTSTTTTRVFKGTQVGDARRVWDTHEI